MSVHVRDGAILLEGRCPAQDAEDLLRALQETPGACVDIEGVVRLHMAVLQVLAALAPPIRGRPPAGTMARDVFRGLISASDSTREVF